jgi:hypothetical protein
MGNQTFYGPGKTIDTKKPVTVVTQFVTSDNTESGDLVEIRRLYVQGGKVWQQPTSNVAGISGNSITDTFCKNQKTVFGDNNHFARTGGLKAMGDAFQKGMVLVMSLWDDYDVNMVISQHTSMTTTPLTLKLALAQLSVPRDCRPKRSRRRSRNLLHHFRKTRGCRARQPRRDRHLLQHQDRPLRLHLLWYSPAWWHPWYTWRQLLFFFFQGVFFVYQSVIFQQHHKGYYHHCRCHHHHYQLEGHHYHRHRRRCPEVRSVRRKYSPSSIRDVSPIAHTDRYRRASATLDRPSASAAPPARRPTITTRSACRQR